MIDFEKETLLSLAAVAKRFGVAIETVRRWARAVGGLRLETAKLVGKRFTTSEAIQRFSQQNMEQKRLPLASKQRGAEILPLFAEKVRARTRKAPSDKENSAHAIASNFWMRPFIVSVTYRQPRLSRTIP